MPVAKEIVDTLRQCKYNQDNHHTGADACSLTHLNLSHNGLSKASCLSIVGGLYGSGRSGLAGGVGEFSMRSLHLNGNDPSPFLSHQAVTSTHPMQGKYLFSQ